METLIQNGRMHFTTIILVVVVVLVVAWSVVSAQLNAPATIQYVSPQPGSSNNSLQTNIIVRLQHPFPHGILLSPSSINVEGSVSGHHSGNLILSKDDQTVLFNPDSQFVQHEVVSVTIASSIYDQTGKDETGWKFKFETSFLSALVQKNILQKISTHDDPIGSPYVEQSIPYFSKELYVNSNDTVPDDLPKPTVIMSDNPSNEPIYFATWKGAIGYNSFAYIPNIKSYLMISDNNGKVIYYKRVGRTTDFKLLSNGNLSYFDYDAVKFYEMNHNFMIIDSFKCGNGYQTDPHDIRLLNNNHRLLIGLDPQKVNMKTIIPGGDTAATVIGIVIQELDQQKNVVFQWRSFDHFLITDATHENLAAGTIDYVHPNAIDIDYDGNILLCSRHMDEITKIDRSTGNIIWRWGGKNNQFAFINDSIGFSHQHDIDLTSSGTYTIFDNGNFHTPAYSRALEYSLDQQKKTATLIWQFRHKPDTYTFAMGSVERLPNGNTFIGWGANYLSATEVRPDGSTAYEIQYNDSLISYRAFRFPWQTTSTAVGTTPITPMQFELKQNYPNPFNPSTTIEYVIPKQSFVKLIIFDMLGREVSTLVREKKEAGTYSVVWNASPFASGVYFYKLQANDFIQTRKILLIK